jgi:hypothetical protein
MKRKPNLGKLGRVVCASEQTREVGAHRLRLMRNKTG